MPGAWSAAGDFDTSMFGMSQCLDTLISHLKDAIHGMSSHGMPGHGPGWGGPPWEKGFGRFKGARGGSAEWRLVAWAARTAAAWPQSQPRRCARRDPGPAARGPA
jgi:hypothetical protein